MARDRDAWFKHFVGDVAAETAYLTPAAAGAYLLFRNTAWNAPTRGVLSMKQEGFARLFHCQVDTALRLIEELTSEAHQLMTAEKLPDGSIQLSYPAFAKMGDIRDKRAAAGAKGGSARLLKQNASKPPSKPLCSVFSLGMGDARGKGENEVDNSPERAKTLLSPGSNGAIPLENANRSEHECGTPDEPGSPQTATSHLDDDPDYAVPDGDYQRAVDFCNEHRIDTATDRKAVENVRLLLAKVTSQRALELIRQSVRNRSTWPTRYALGIVQKEEERRLGEPKHSSSAEWLAKPYTPG
jgi:hypothetical protein